MLFGRATIVSDYVLPITPKSERILVAVKTTDEPKLTANVEKWMKTEPDAKPRQYKEHLVWEIVNADTEVAAAPQKKSTVALAKKQEDQEDDEEDSREHLLPNSAVTVAHGELLVASHYDFLTKMLDQLAQREQLVDSNEYRLVKTESIACRATRSAPKLFHAPTKNIGAPTN